VTGPAAPAGGPTEDWHWRARRALARFAPHAVGALARALETATDPAVRLLAVDALARLGPRAAGAAPALRGAVRHDGDAAVRAAARAALAVVEPGGPPAC
jgi:HEAT repeat protein